jgi:DeoR/GlpR family transcriptional regulator of sugar metabolism
MPPTSQQRKDYILRKILQDGHIMVRDLTVEMDASEATVRRDLRALSDAGEVELIYGGATLPRSSDFSFRSKAQRFTEAKQAIGRLAADLVHDGETIFLDSGTTVSEMAPHLKRKRGLCVIVNSTRLAADLGGGKEGASIITLGGQYRSDRMDTVGPLAVSTLEQLHGFRAFIGADGLNTDFGVTASDIDSSHLYRLAVKHARETVLLVDHSKFLSPSLFKICELEHISRLVTDREPPPEWLRFLNEKGVEVIHPENPDSQSAGAKQGE